MRSSYLALLAGHPCLPYGFTGTTCCDERTSVHNLSRAPALQCRSTQNRIIAIGSCRVTYREEPEVVFGGCAGCQMMPP
jgi:hypothetical protein